MFRKIAWIFGALVVIITSYVVYVMLTTKSHSPAAVAEYSDDGFLIQVDYFQPFKKDRLIFGEKKDDALVPFGKKWRTGANEATEISFNEDVIINGNVLNAGRYSLYTIPDASSWTIAFNSKLDYWGAGGDPFDETLDVLRVQATVRTDVPETERFTISFTPVDDNLVYMNFLWDRTQVTLPIEKAQ